jgi:hypothetical protein
MDLNAKKERHSFGFCKINESFLFCASGIKDGIISS